MSALAFTTAVGLLARAGHISEDEVSALFHGDASGGAALERLILTGTLSEVEAADLVAMWTMVPRSMPGTLDLVEAEILARLPAEVAAELRAVPAGTEPDGSLRVAMVDPADERAATELTFFCGTDILREAATMSEIARALARHPERRLPAATIIDEPPAICIDDEPPAICIDDEPPAICIDDEPPAIYIDDEPTGPRRLPPAEIVDEDADVAGNSRGAPPALIIDDS